IAAVALGGGPSTVGILMAGIACGSVAAGVFSGPLGHVRRHGLAVVIAVIGWGVAVTAFGVVVGMAPGPGPDGSATSILWPAVGCMVLAGAADQVSSIFRMTILQAATPDAMRGRLQGVFIVVVAGGPRLGDLLLGSAGELAGEAVAATGGGLACIGVVVILALVQRRFLHYDSSNPRTCARGGDEGTVDGWHRYHVVPGLGDRPHGHRCSGRRRRARQGRRRDLAAVAPARRRRVVEDPVGTTPTRRVLDRGQQPGAAHAGLPRRLADGLSQRR